MKHTMLTLASLVALALPGCNSAPNLAAPDLRLNQDTCHECGMMISEERHAAAIMTLRDGLEEKLLFDDTGEMLEFQLPPGAQHVRRYVHDYATGQWTDADTAHYVKSKDFRTPMGTGVVAFATESDATAAATQRQGTLLPNPFPTASATAAAQ